MALAKQDAEKDITDTGLFCDEYERFFKQFYLTRDTKVRRFSLEPYVQNASSMTDF